MLSPKPKPPVGLLLLIAAQIICAVFFLADALEDLRAFGLDAFTSFYLLVEMSAALLLCAAIIFEIRVVLDLLRRKAALEHNLSVAQQAMHDVIEAHFDGWKLTPTERDIATFLVKGMAIAEIATLRGSAEGTVKSHLNAIYRKSGTGNRGELLALILDSVMQPD
ncbi:helix-turn-helix transcriptional regulator [Shimia aestuarii]|uniref:Regulatory protein, luxR family n=1 Tax=Shimia aestuarii TaxID=254406 RepID=A0A1I4S808_9RHOB|nr:helix-turn-helix transcriptional regulator [Shimia aestuarii]SFM60424.1 regulatory protein, luxR family [Shimia aestuarii]